MEISRLFCQRPIRSLRVLLGSPHDIQYAPSGGKKIKVQVIEMG